MSDANDRLTGRVERGLSKGGSEEVVYLGSSWEDRGSVTESLGGQGKNSTAGSI